MNTIKEILKSILPEKFNIFLWEKKRDVLTMAKQAKYYSISIFVQVIKKKYMHMKCIFKANKKNIIWIGCFPPNESNIGDHAQSLAVEKFFKEIFQITT